MQEYQAFPSGDLEIAQLGEPVLRLQAKPVVNFNDPDLVVFCRRLLDTMQRQGGVGIAAPQVFCSQQLMYIASKPNPRYPDAPKMEPLLLVNPKITRQSNVLVKDWEGCLSIPGIRAKVPRSEWGDISFQDINGNELNMRLDGFVARIFLHEYDHLIGLSYLDSVTDNREIVAEPVYLKLVSSAKAE